MLEASDPAHARPRRRLQVRRALPSAQRRMVGPFVFFDQMGPVDARAPARASTCGRIRTSASRPSPISSKARSCIATAWARVQPIRPGDVNWMTAGPRHRRIPSARPPSCARPARASPASRPGSALPRERRGDRAGLRAHRGRPRCRCSRTRGIAPAADPRRAGTASARRCRRCADVLCRRALDAGARFQCRPSTPSARAYVAAGRGEHDGQDLRGGRSCWSSAPAPTLRVSGASACARHALRRRAARRHALHVVELRLQPQGAHRAGRGRLEGRRFAAIPGETEFIPLPENAPSIVNYP